MGRHSCRAHLCHALTHVRPGPGHAGICIAPSCITYGCSTRSVSPPLLRPAQGPWPCSMHRALQHFSIINRAGPDFCQRKVHTKCWTLKVMHQPAAHFAAIVACRLPQRTLPGWNWHRLLAETILAVTRLALRGRWQSFNTCSHFIEPSGHLSLPCREGREEGAGWRAGFGQVQALCGLACRCKVFRVRPSKLMPWETYRAQGTSGRGALSGP